MAATSNSTASTEYVGDGNSVGTVFGQSGEKIAFYGATPVASTTVAAVATAATAATIVTSLQALQAALDSLGIVPTS